MKLFKILKFKILKFKILKFKILKFKKIISFKLEEEMHQNQNRELLISKSYTSFRQNYLNLINFNDKNFTNDWGWFIDIENTSYNINKGILKPNWLSKFRNIDTKKQSIRSMKSLHNLCDTYMIFDMDEENLFHKTNKKEIILINLGCIIFIILFYILYNLNLNTIKIN
jgi:hypothetical protein